MKERKPLCYQDLEAKQKKRFFITMGTFALVLSLILIFFSAVLYTEKQHARDSWDDYLSDLPEQAARVAQLSQNAAKAKVGTYVENIRELNIKGSTYRVECMVWFDWEGDEALDLANHFRVYKGVLNKKELLDEYHEGNRHYQLVSIDVTVSKNSNTRRFPLDSQQLRLYIEATHPVQEIIFEPDRDNSGMKPNLTLTGYEFLRNDIGAVSFVYESTHGHPALESHEVTSEIVTAMEINRDGLGLYVKCFIAMVGTISWVLIALFLSSHHQIDPISLLPGALFGTVSNIMIGAALLPDALEMGLLEFVNIWGILTILSVAFAVISVNTVRKKHEEHAFANYYGRRLFFLILFFAIAGQVILPAIAYLW